LLVGVAWMCGWRNSNQSNIFLWEKHTLFGTPERWKSHCWALKKFCGGALITKASLSSLANTHHRCASYFSLRKQPTAEDATTAFSAKWRHKKRAQKFHTDVASLPRSEWYFWLVARNLLQTGSGVAKYRLFLRLIRRAFLRITLFRWIVLLNSGILLTTELVSAASSGKW